MVTDQNFKIASTFGYLPQSAVTSIEMDDRLQMPPGWTEKNTGVLKRHQCLAPETIVTMAAHAMRGALEQAECRWSDIDLIIDCSTSRVRPIPCNAAHLQEAIGIEASGIPCFDLQSTCLGSILAVHVANALFGTGAYRKILIVASESALAGVNLKQPESAGLIGDGSAAILLEHSPAHGKLAFVQETFAQHLDLCVIQGGGHHKSVFEFQPDRREEYLFHMDGPAVFRAAISHLPKMVHALVEEWKALPHQSEIPQTRELKVVPHQASKKALDAMRRILGFSSNHFKIAVEQVGNMAAASVPWVLDHSLRSQWIQKGDSVMLLGTSAGYSQAALIFEI